MGQAVRQRSPAQTRHPHPRPRRARHRRRRRSRRLDADAARATRDRHLTLSEQTDGRLRLTGTLDAETAGLLRAAIDPLTALSGPDDQRSAGQRRHDALADLCRLSLRTGELPEHGGDPAQIVITTHYDDLTRQLDTGTLDTGLHLTPETVRRLACDAAILPTVLNGTGQPLDVGRQRRLITGPLRRALVLRDSGCAFPGCDRPPAGATPTTSDTGPTAAPPASTTPSCSAPTTTATSTTATGPSNWQPTAARSSSHPPGSTPTNSPPQPLPPTNVKAAESDHPGRADEPPTGEPVCRWAWDIVRAQHEMRTGLTMRTGPAGSAIVGALAAAILLFATGCTKQADTPRRQPSRSRRRPRR
ncbi:DUF222 domain-containing protein [Micromonospora sp. M12]